jgi:hypothetical protein
MTPAKSNASHSGEATVMPIVLVQNDRTAGGRFDDFEDITGQQFHFIENYLPRVIPGTPFVYYRGVRLAGRGRRSTPEYFGCGRIGDVWRDERTPPTAPRNERRWFCAIEEYIPFPEPIPARVNGLFLEQIPRNLLGVSVRRLSDGVFNRILQLAGVVLVGDSGEQVYLTKSLPIAELRIHPTDDLLRTTRGGATVSSDHHPGKRSRRSAYAKATGDRAEAIVLRHLQETLPPAERESLRWVADSGEKPGWDIEYNRAGDQRIAVEVKGTAGTFFPSFELTAREWEAAQTLRERYWLYLVADCLGATPLVQAIQDPAAMVMASWWTLAPVLWSITPRNGPREDCSAV